MREDLSGTECLDGRSPRAALGRDNGIEDFETASAPMKGKTSRFGMVWELGDEGLERGQARLVAVPQTRRAPSLTRCRGGREILEIRSPSPPVPYACQRSSERKLKAITAYFRRVSLTFTFTFTLLPTTLRDESALTCQDRLDGFGFGMLRV